MYQNIRQDILFLIERVVLLIHILLDQNAKVVELRMQDKKIH